MVKYNPVDIPWYEWRYWVCYKTNTVHSYINNKWKKVHRIMKITPRKTWHLYITLKSSWRKIWWWIHELVMLIKEWPCPEWLEVCHNDWDPQNNHPDNLRYDTRSNNMKDRHKHGYISYFKTSPHLIQHFSVPVEQVSLDGSVICTFKSMAEAWEKLGIDPSGISKIIKWKKKSIRWFMFRKLS